MDSTDVVINDQLQEINRLKDYIIKMEEQNNSLEGQMVEMRESMQRENERLW